MKKFLILIKKDLFLEKRNSTSLTGMFTISCILCILSSLGVQISLVSPEIKEKIFSVLFWIIGFFSASLYVPKFFDREWNYGGIQTLKLFGFAKHIVYLSKVFSLFIIVCINQIVNLVLLVILLNLSTGMWVINIIPVVIITSFCFSLVGALLAPISHTTKLGSSIYTLISIPLLTPLFFTTLEISQELRYENILSNFWLLFYFLLLIIYFSIGITLSSFTYKSYD